MGECPQCGAFRWYPGTGNTIFKVPGSTTGKPPLVEVTHSRNSLIHHLKTPRKIRLPGSLRYYSGQDAERKKKSKNRSHIEVLLGMKNKPTGRGWANRLDNIRDILREFGLEATQLLSGKVNADEPILLHWKGKDPFQNMPAFRASSERTPSARAAMDPKWQQYNSDITHFNTWYPNRFRPKQKEAIDSILKKTGTLQIIALPTGYGKTRICQTVTRVLRHHEEGPTLMISPLVALRDDQRDAFENQLNKPFGHYGDEGTEVAFLTQAEKNIDSVSQRLINDELDLLCCAPEHILVPSYNQSWFEIFHRMKKPFSTLVVDEAHLIGDWGSSFRSQFLLLGQLKDRLLEMNPKLRVVLQSATLTQNERDELEKIFSGLDVLKPVEILDTRQDLHFRIEFDTPQPNATNRHIDYEAGASKLADEWLQMPSEWMVPWNDKSNIPRSPLLIYSPIKGQKEELVKEIGQVMRDKYDLNTAIFTGDTPSGQKDVRRTKFKDNQMDALVATSAFGMGIDKEDVWLIGYLGLPFTLKGLYQGFGRAARGSNWDGVHTGFTPRNGNCIAIIPNAPGKLGSKGMNEWRPSLGIEKASERIWDMLMSPDAILLPEQGYAIAPVLEGIHTNSEWLMQPKQAADYRTTVGDEDQDEEDKELDVMWTDADWEEANRKLQLAHSGTYEKNRDFRLWSLAALQREVPTGRFVSIIGFYPEFLCEDKNTGKRTSLEQALRDGGYKEVRRVLLSVDASKGVYTTSPQQRMALIRFEKPSSGWDSVVRALEAGHADLKARHDEGNKELQTFIQMARDKQCIRKAFAPAIGGNSSEAQDCTELFSEWHNHPPNNKPKVQPPVPCSSCLTDPVFAAVATRSPSLCLWLDEGSLRALRGDPPTPPIPADPRSIDWDTPTPLVVFRIDDSGNPLKIALPQAQPPEFLDFHGEPCDPSWVPISGGIEIDDHPIGSRAVAIFSGGSGNIFRFVDKLMIDELEVQWKAKGVAIHGKV